MRDANAKLAPRHREVLALRQVAGRSYEEIGDTLGITESAAAQLIWRARTKLKEALTAGAVASVVATSEECEWAQLLLSRVQDGEPVDEADRAWLKKHLDECDSCKTANRMLLEIGASYRCWLPVALFAGMRTETLTKAGELVGADWSHVPTPGKGAAAGGLSAGGVGGVTVARLNGCPNNRGDRRRRNRRPCSVAQRRGPKGEPAAKQSARASAASTQSAPARDTDRKEASAGGQSVAARAASSGAAPALAAGGPAPPPDPPIGPPAPQTPSAPFDSAPPQDGSGQSDGAEQLLEVGPGPDQPRPPTRRPSSRCFPTCRPTSRPSPFRQARPDATQLHRGRPRNPCRMPAWGPQGPPNGGQDPPGEIIKDPPEIIKDRRRSRHAAGHPRTSELISWRGYRQHAAALFDAHLAVRVVAAGVACRVEPRGLLLAEAEACGTKVVLELLHRTGAEDHRFTPAGRPPTRAPPEPS